MDTFFEDKYLWILFVLMIIYTVLFSVLSYEKYLCFKSSWPIDLAVYNQAFYGTFRGFPETTIYPIMRWGDGHFSLIWFVIAFIYLVFPNILVMFLLGSLVVALSALPIYLISKKRFDSGMAGLVFAILFLIHPTLLSINLDDFSMEKLAIPLLLSAFYFFHEKKFKSFFLFICLSMTVRENLSLLIVMVGFYALYHRREMKWVFMPIVAGTAWFFGAKYFLDRHILYNGFQNTLGFLFYDDLQIHLLIKNLFNGKIFDHILSTNVLSKMLLLFTGPYMVSLLSPHVLLLAFPEFMKNMLLRMPHDTFGHGSYYYSLIIPIIILGLINSVAWIFEHARKIPWVRLHCKAILFMVLFLLLSVGLYNSSTYVRSQSFFEKENFIQGADAKTVWRLIEKIPQNAVVSIDFRFIPAVSLRPMAYIFGKDRRADETADYILANYESGKDSIYFTGRKRITTYMKDTATWEILAKQDSYVLLKKH